LDIEKSLTRTHQSPLESPDNILLEPSYMESVRRYHELAEVERCHQWVDFHRQMTELHRKLSEEHEVKAEALMESLHMGKELEVRSCEH
jgi:hypothetical protein